MKESNGSTVKLVIVGLAAALAFSQFGPLGIILVGVIAMIAM